MAINFIEEFEEIVKEDVEERVEELEGYLIEECPVDTGAMMDSIQTEKKSDFDYLVGVDADMLASDNRNERGIDYSPFVYNGVSRPVTIYPRNAMYLRWKGKDGKIHFATKVTIPPRKADRFLDRAVARMNLD